MSDLQMDCRDYLAARTSDYPFRCLRFAAVAHRLYSIGFTATSSLYDVGAGRCDFERYLRHLGWEGEYAAVDGAIDGTDLETWVPTWYADFMVAIEVIEHLINPYRLVSTMIAYTRHGVVITTPNPDVVDVLAIDPTHKTPISANQLRAHGGTVSEVGLFDVHPRDSLLAWWEG